MSEWDLDLLGDPIPDGLGKRGRPPHLVTVENRRKVIVLAAFERTEDEIAAALGISAPTLRKHYFRELRSRAEARFRLEGKMLIALVDQAEKGNVTAVDKLYKRLDRQDMLRMGAPAKKAKEPKLGKKEARQAAARDLTKQPGTWGSLMASGRPN